MSRKRKLTAVASTGILLAGLSLTTAPEAQASVSGSVDCTYGNNAEVGVWVEAGSHSGWASLTPDGYGGAYYSYGAISAGTTYRLHVGCGGTPQNWGITFYTPYVSGGYYDWVCTTGYGCVES